MTDAVEKPMTESAVKPMNVSEENMIDAIDKPKREKPTISGAIR